MDKGANQSLWQKTWAHIEAYQAGLDERHVGSQADFESLCKSLGGDQLGEMGEPADSVIDALVKTVDKGLIASSGPRYFGFVTGGTHPAALAADYLTSCWDQNAWAYVNSPAATAVEHVAGHWLIDLFGLPAGTRAGFVTDATMANFSALAAARSAVLARYNYDVEEFGLSGAPEIAVFTGDKAHASILAAVKMLGLGHAHVHQINTDSMGRIKVDELARQLAEWQGPAIVCAQAGEVNTGAFDPFVEIADQCEKHHAWLHIDGAFGLWAAASPKLRRLLVGVDRADSWTADGHKWLNVPYDAGYVFFKHGEFAKRALTADAAYYPETSSIRQNFHYVPESSRRARGFVTYAALRAMGRAGLEEMIERTVMLAQYTADKLSRHPHIHVLNDVVLNQVLIRIQNDDRHTDRVIRAVCASGEAWLGGTTWQGMRAIRLSISNHATCKEDMDRSMRAIVACV